MNCAKLILCLIIVTSSKLYSLSGIEHYLHKIRSFFNSQSAEQTDHKEFSTVTLQSISIENGIGPITIKTGWKKKCLCLKTVKRAKNQTQLDAIKIITDNTKPHHLSVRTKQLYGMTTGRVEYELIIPSLLNVSLKTENGNIYINDTKGTINALAHSGNIIIINTENNIYAESSSTGSIYIENAQGPVEAYTRYGSIRVNDACNSIDARTKKGKIDIAYKELASTHKVSAQTSSGHITVSLPTSSDATITGVTTHGKIISDHYITLKPYTTQLNANAWNKLKKEICGTIGTGQASLSLSSIQGNIAILESKAHNH